tara:strand:- start:4086 stop:4721 length:636 start_codon:yes stop_codon:yes gene_type:complete
MNTEKKKRKKRDKDGNYLFGVCGGSCSGKSTFVAALAKVLGEENCSLFSQDNFYYENFDKVRFEYPESIDNDKMRFSLYELKMGLMVELPVFDVATRSLMPFMEDLESKKILILEGSFLLHWEEIRGALDESVFLDFPTEERLQRRIKRDTIERGFPKEQVEKEFNESAEKIHQDLIIPSKNFATHVVNDEESFSKLVNDLGEKFKGIIES